MFIATNSPNLSPNNRRRRVSFLLKAIVAMV